MYKRQALGGPGAVLWCWLSGIFGIATKYSESLIAVKYRVKTKDGRMQGGAMYALSRGCLLYTSILKKYVRYASCFMRGRVVSVLAATERGFSKYLHIIVDEIVQSVRRIMNMQGTVGVSRSTEHLENCAECYREAMNALSYSWPVSYTHLSFDSPWRCGRWRGLY